MRKTCYLRNVEDTDRELLFRWANDAVTRSRSFSQAPITWEEHTAWFARVQAKEDCPHWILLASGDTAGEPDNADGELEDAAGKRLKRNENRENIAYHSIQCAECPVGVLRLAKGENSGSYRISYSIAPEWRGHGYGTKILELAKTWMISRDPGCMELYGEVKADNPASARCFEKAGYKGADKKSEVLCYRADLRKERVLYFRADGGKQMGSGHLMRCLTIADACVEKGMQAVFVTADAEAEAAVLERGYPCLVLNTDYRDMDSEIGKLLPLLRGGAPVVLDSYFLTRRYVEMLRENGHPAAWLDDLSKQCYPVDLLVNYNLYAKEQEKQMLSGNDPAVPFTGGAQRRETGIRLLGASYAPVRPSFQRGKTTAGKQIRRILVMTGGSDPYGAGVLFARLLGDLLPETERLAVCGPYVEDKDALYALAGQDPNLKVIEGCSDLSDVMHRCDLAVAAAGSALYELCAAGLPCIVYYMADNQRMGAEVFARETGAVNLGDLRADGFGIQAQRKLESALAQLAAVSERQRLADAMHALVDGQGAARIAESLSMLADGARRSHSASEEDMPQ